MATNLQKIQGNKTALALKLGGVRNSSDREVLLDQLELYSALIDLYTVSSTLTGPITITGDLTVQGDFAVDGSTLSNVTIEDPLMLLAKNVTAAPSYDAGFVVERGTSANVASIWDESEDEFAFITTTETGSTAGNIVVSSYAGIHCGTIIGDSIDLTPSTNADAIDITGTNLTSASVLDIDLAARTGNTIGVIDVALGTSDIEASEAILRLTDGRNHDDAAGDEYLGITVEQSGNFPGTNASTFYGINFEYTGTLGASGALATLYGIKSDLSAATLTAGTYAAGYFSDGTSTVVLGDGTNAITTSQSISAGTFTDGTFSVSLGQFTAVSSITDGTANWASNNLYGFSSIGCSTLNITPASDIDGLVLDTTNVQTSHIIDLATVGLTTGSIIDIGTITTKTSGYLYNGSMTTSTLDATTILDDFSVSCDHDDGAGDTLSMVRRAWSGNIPGSNAASLTLFEGSFSGTVGSAGSSATAYLFKGDVSGATVTAGTVAVARFVDSSNQVVACEEGGHALGVTGAVADTATIGDGNSPGYYNMKTLYYTIGDPTDSDEDYQFASQADKAEQGIQLGGGAIIPANSRVLDVIVRCTEDWTGTAGDETGLGTEIGNASGGAQYANSANVDDVNDITYIANNGVFVIAPSTSASSVYISCTPTVNDWDEFTAGKLEVYVTYIDNSAVS